MSLKSKIQHTILTSDNLEEDLFFLVTELAPYTHQVDLYNAFHKQLENIQENYDEAVYTALANTMDIIWNGNKEYLQLYPKALTDGDIVAREASKKIFGKGRKF